MKQPTLSLLLLIACAPSAPAQTPSDCANPLPLNLNVGIPWIARKDLVPRALAKDIYAVASTLYSEAPKDPCSSLRRLHVNVALGNDYQMLDWLNRGLLDVAIIPDLSLCLLVRDTPGIYEIDPALAGDEMLPRKAAVGTLEQRYRKAPEGWRPIATKLDDAYGQYLESVLSAAVATDDNVCADGNTAEYKPHAGPPVARRVMFASHLSSTGFLEPLRLAYVKFTGRLSAMPLTHEERRRLRNRVWTEFFQSAQFAIDCDSVQTCLKATADADRGDDAHKIRDGTLMLYFPGEIAAPAAGGTLFREHLVITKEAAARVFGVQKENSRFRKPAAAAPIWLNALIDNPPAPLKTTMIAEPTFGVRTYSFTVREALALIHQQQRNGSDANLALVLPGGGVKAAYQTRIVDELYNEHKALKNGAVAGNPDALQVSTVIGTSGGALLGYFVAQLKETPVVLYDILWRKGKTTLASSDVFGVTDMPRYVSIVFAMAIFCGWLSLFPAPKPAERKLKTRWRLLATTWPLFLLTPLLIRRVSQGDDFEHIPDIEGVFYMVMTVIVMAADQCVIVADQPKKPERSYHVPVLLIGLLFIGLPFIGLPFIGGSSRFDAPVTFIVAFLTISLFVIGAAMAVAWGHDRLGNPRWRAFDIVTSIALVLLLCRFGVLNSIKLEHIHAAVAIIAVAVIEYLWVRTLPERAAMRGASLRHMALQWLITFIATFLIAALCWPDEPVDVSSFGFLTTQSPTITNGALFVSLGLILIAAGLALWTAWVGRYEMREGKEFLAGLGILLVHSVAVLLIIAVLGYFFENLVVGLELTNRFWIATFIVSALAGFGVIIAARFNRHMYPGLIFLRTEHPNGRTIPRRYARMMAVASISVLWWNFVQAPALYGNAKARKYHYAAIDRFNVARYPSHTSKEVDAQRRNPPFEPTARFVAPANLLRTDGTRYFMFVDRQGPCPSIPPRPASGADWLVYRVSGKGLLSGPKCDGPNLDIRPQSVAEAAFASGSPFPIFAAHALTIGGQRETYVDGGYSNNIPVDAARTIQAKQVLIIQSSSALPPTDDAPPTLWQKVSWVPGKLIHNLGRLPSYLFERSQQMDRLSTLDLFVVSLSPDRDAPNWPPLFDFRKATVNRMGCEASRDLGRRIGIVQSWGQPQFRIDVQDITLSSAPPATQ